MREFVGDGFAVFASGLPNTAEQHPLDTERWAPGGRTRSCPSANWTDLQVVQPLTESVLARYVRDGWCLSGYLRQNALSGNALA